MSNTGVRDVVAMKITGHKTPSMYRRYNIVNEADKVAALEKTQAHVQGARCAADEGHRGRLRRRGQGRRGSGRLRRMNPYAPYAPHHPSRNDEGGRLRAALELLEKSTDEVGSGGWI
jgi:hypothetical protein